MEMTLKKENIIFGIIGMALSLYVFWATSQFPKDKIMGIGPSFFPRILATGLFVFGFILIVLNLLKADQSAGKSFSIKDPGIQRSIIAFTATMVYVFAISFLGFVISTIIYLASLMYLMRFRKIIRVTIISVSVSIVVYTIFNTLLNISLPKGFWS